MTARLVIGIDPGHTGAFGFVADGVFAGLFDTPVMARKTKGFEVDAATMADKLRAAVAQHPGAYVVAVLEQASAIPVIPRPGGKRIGMGASSAFNYGEGYGAIKGVLAATRIPLVVVPPAKWKAALNLRGAQKDAARAMAIQRYPTAAEHLQRKKDDGRGEALLIAHWAELTEAVGPARSPAVGHPQTPDQARLELDAASAA